MERLHKVIVALAIVGLTLSSVGYGAIHFGRGYLEEGARDVVASRTEQKVRELVTPRPAEGEGTFAAMRNKVVEKAVAGLRHAIGKDYPERLRRRIGELCVCQMSPAEIETILSEYEEAKSEVERVITAALAGDFDQARITPGTFRGLIDGYYVETVEGLVRDLRIFFGLNILLYLMAGTVAWFAHASRAVLTSVGLLVVSNIVAGYGYVFDSNWLATIVFHAWLGYGYLVIVAILFLAYGYNLWRIRSHMALVREVPA
jgi:hypothetical protein